MKEASLTRDKKHQEGWVAVWQKENDTVTDNPRYHMAVAVNPLAIAMSVVTDMHARDHKHMDRHRHSLMDRPSFLPEADFKKEKKTALKEDNTGREQSWPTYSQIVDIDVSP
ncbi:hypothetical protein RUM43_014588 [Polyplax serrata]|uniref:Uncharacterized protein n=1 Tax=Polyplax serrata TaxID=468196 RepID=A0AAN8PGA3_POLSC